MGFLLETQERDGSWYGRWGVNYLYGTFLALRGLRAAQDPSASKAMWKAGKWIASVQNEDGGWGESCASYNEGHFVPAPSTPSQTAWALLGLVAAGQGDTEVLARGVRHLIDTQKPDGTWDESLATGTGFPNVFYLRYTLYRGTFRSWPSPRRAAPWKRRSERCASCRNRSRRARSAERARAGATAPARPHALWADTSITDGSPSAGLPRLQRHRRGVDRRGDAHGVVHLLLGEPALAHRLLVRAHAASRSR